MKLNLDKREIVVFLLRFRYFVVMFVHYYEQNFWEVSYYLEIKIIFSNFLEQKKAELNY